MVMMSNRPEPAGQFQVVALIHYSPCVIRSEPSSWMTSANGVEFTQGTHVFVMTVPKTYTYHEQILGELALHGLCPLPSTAPDRLRDAVRDLYKYEIRRLRAEVLAGRIKRPDYAGHIVELRKRYALLSIPTELWTK